MYHNNKHFSDLVSHHGGKTAGLDVIRRNYVVVTLFIHGVKVRSDALRCVVAPLGNTSGVIV